MDFCLIFSVGLGSGIGIKSMIFLVHFPGKSTKKWEKNDDGTMSCFEFWFLEQIQVLLQGGPKPVMFVGLKKNI